MSREKPQPIVPSVADEVRQIDLREHLVQLTDKHAAIAREHQLERELVARVLLEGGTWDDVATATGMSARECRKAWARAPEGDLGKIRAYTSPDATGTVGPPGQTW